MSDEINESPLQFVGPFEHHEVVLDGRAVPFLSMTPHGEDSMTVTLDDRFGLELTPAEAERVVPFLAHAIAIGLGYTCHPTADMEPIRAQPFTRFMGIVGFE